MNNTIVKLSNRYSRAQKELSFWRFQLDHHNNDPILYFLRSRKKIETAKYWINKIDENLEKISTELDEELSNIIENHVLYEWDVVDDENTIINFMINNDEEYIIPKSLLDFVEAMIVTSNET